MCPDRSDPFSTLEGSDSFVSRHIGPSTEETEAMLALLGLKTLDELTAKVVPAHLRAQHDLNLPAPRTEPEAFEHAALTANHNEILKSYIGLGYHSTVTPQVILRNVLEDPGWYTAYTPYQAEISQGRLEALLNFQTLISDLTGLPIANASLLDEGTAAAEAMSMAFHLAAKKKGDKRLKFWVSSDCHPQTVDVLETRAKPLGIQVVTADRSTFGESLDETFFGSLIQYPSTTGEVFDPSEVIEATHAAGGLSILAADLLSLTLLRSPASLGADVCVGNSQRFGVPLGFGGPHAGFFSTTEKFKRSIPGRMVGLSKDAAGRPALRLALQTREQHIRREKATSNICTAQVLLAVIASFYAVYHGPKGLSRIAQRLHRLATTLAAGLREQGREIVHDAFFDTIAVRVSSVDSCLAFALQAGYNLRRIDDHTVGIALDETTQARDIEALWDVFRQSRAASRNPSGTQDALDFADLETDTPDSIPHGLERRTSFLEHPVFNSFHSETDMMRYLRRLRDRDVALNRSMIPLGSCTMKLNAATEMQPITWRSFAQLHPFAPADQAGGFHRMIHELEEQLKAITGFDAVSLQPNAGSQGEYAGLLAISAYHESRGDSQRRICLIPSSAHGTNPASAAMAGLKVVVVACDSSGNVDVADLRRLCEKHASELAALMITYPSTHGVFEESLVEICEAVHEHGGQVYLDGANLNALVGVCYPGKLGADVAHMNLHKTFCIPHGGGGPGIGPIGVRSHLEPFLPGHCLSDGEIGRANGAVAAAPWGSAGILPIPWVYIHLMGGSGLTKATQVAILNANYMATRLAPHYDILYRGPNDMVAHECILDLRPLKKSADIDVSNVAKRLIDFGFHAPTMSWPVAGTLMIEPTESESQAELDRFCDAMIAIRQEIREIENGELDADDNPLKHAPHTAEDVTQNDWPHAYSREQAAYPLAWVRADKYWPPVGLIDNLHGDRNLVCTCPPIEDYDS